MPSWTDPLRLPEGRPTGNPNGRPAVPVHVLQRMYVLAESSLQISVIAAELGYSTSTVKKYLGQKWARDFRPTWQV